MKIFIGSSRETLEKVRQLASWLEEAGHEPLVWDDPELFLPGESTFTKLIEIAKDTQAAIFVFGEDDSIWYRRDAMTQPRDNVLVEYGLFSGALGQRHVIICRVGASKMPTDTGGITFVSLDKPMHARLAILAWMRDLVRHADGTVPDAPLVIERAMLKKQLEEARDRLSFEEQKSRDLQQLATRAGIIDFDDYSGTAGNWKLLFDYNFFWALVDILGTYIHLPNQFHDYLRHTGIGWVAQNVNWDQGGDPGRKPIYMAKALRRIRAASMDDGVDALEALLHSEASWSGLGEQVVDLAERSSAGIRQTRK